MKIPDFMMDEALIAREHLLESIAEFNDELMMLVLEGEDVPSELIKKAIRRGTIHHGFIPVLCGSSLK
ncbi:MAG TPA: hypothetical protein DG355_08670, partial [Candidatus Cloacimonas sp.]|nr:hypothetical protein [Candidatus Cloacimonas sp.]